MSRSLAVFVDQLPAGSRLRGPVSGTSKTPTHSNFPMNTTSSKSFLVALLTAVDPTARDLVVAFTGVLAITILAMCLATWQGWEIESVTTTGACTDAATCAVVKAEIENSALKNAAANDQRRERFELVVEKGLLNLFGKLIAAVLTFVLGVATFAAVRARWG